MAERVDTLVVFTSNRGPQIIADQVAALDWACTRPHRIVVTVDHLPGAEVREFADHTRVLSRIQGGRHRSGFKNHEAILWALEAGVEFDCVLCVDDDALPLRRGLDAWGLDMLAYDAVDLLGVRDRVNYQKDWPYAARALSRWLPEEARRIKGPTDLYSETIFYPVNWMSDHLVRTLHERQLLVPEGYDEWDNWPDLYISWIAQLLGMYQSCWGDMDAPRPPLYANHRNHMRTAPDPRILSDEFLIYHPISNVNRVSERDLREHYARVRARHPAGAIPPAPP